MASVHAVRTVGSINRAAQASAEESVFNALEKQTEKFVTALTSNPVLANGLKNFDEIVRQLCQKGYQAQLTQLAESQVLSQRARKVIVNALLVN